MCAHDQFLALRHGRLAFRNDGEHLGKEKTCLLGFARAFSVYKLAWGGGQCDILRRSELPVPKQYSCAPPFPVVFLRYKVLSLLPEYSHPLSKKKIISFSFGASGKVYPQMVRLSTRFIHSGASGKVYPTVQGKHKIVARKKL